MRSLIRKNQIKEFGEKTLNLYRDIIKDKDNDSYDIRCIITDMLHYAEMLGLNGKETGEYSLNVRRCATLTIRI